MHYYYGSLLELTLCCCVDKPELMTPLVNLLASRANGREWLGQLTRLLALDMAAPRRKRRTKLFDSVGALAYATMRSTLPASSGD